MAIYRQPCTSMPVNIAKCSEEFMRLSLNVQFAVNPQLTTAQLAVFQSTQGLAMKTLGIGAECLVAEPCGARAEIIRNPAQAAVTGEELRVEVPAEEVDETRRI